MPGKKTPGIASPIPPGVDCVGPRTLRTQSLVGKPGCQGQGKKRTIPTLMAFVFRMTSSSYLPRIPTQQTKGS